MSKSNTARKSADVIDLDTARKGKGTKAETKAASKPSKASKTTEAPKAKAAKSAKPETKAPAAAKAAKGTAKVAPRAAVIVGKATDAKPPRAAKGHFLFAVGKSIAQQALSTNEVTALPNKIPAAAKQLLSEGGTVSKATAKASGLDFAALTAKVQESKRAHVVAKATSLHVTPHADRANIALATVETKPAAKTPKGENGKLSASTQVRVGKSGKVQTEAAKPAKAAAKATKVETKPAKPARKGK